MSHHAFQNSTKLDTFYHSLNSNDQDALDSAAGGNFLDKMPQEGFSVNESKSKSSLLQTCANDLRDFNKEKIREKYDILASNVYWKSFRNLHFEILTRSTVIFLIPLLKTIHLHTSFDLYYFISQHLLLFDESDFLLFEEADAFIAIVWIEQFHQFLMLRTMIGVGEIVILEALLNIDPLPSPGPRRFFTRFQKDLKVVLNQRRSSVEYSTL
ncbi:hypothetical protein Tco_0047135 [Tanacetum coccineum]